MTEPKYKIGETVLCLCQKPARKSCVLDIMYRVDAFILVKGKRTKYTGYFYNLDIYGDDIIVAEIGLRPLPRTNGKTFTEFMRNLYDQPIFKAKQKTMHTDT